MKTGVNDEKKHGLPTYPIKDRMDVGSDRDDDEIEWLLEHGYFMDSPIAFYKKIVKRDGMYVLLSGSHERHLRHHEEDVLAQSPTLDKLLKSKKFDSQPLGRWQWYSNENDGE